MFHARRELPLLSVNWAGSDGIRISEFRECLIGNRFQRLSGK